MAMAKSDRSITIPPANSQMVTEQPSSAIAPALQPTARDEAAKQSIYVETPKALNHGSSQTPPPGYKFVRVRKEDGSVITAIRKMMPKDMQANSHKEPLPMVSDEGVEYKIMTVRNADGDFIRVKRPIKPADDSTTAAIAEARRRSSDNKLPHVVKSEKGIQDPLSPAITSARKTTDEVQEHTDFRAEQTERAAEVPIDLSVALNEQKEYFRQRRMQRFRGSLIRGFGTVLGSSVGHLDFHGSTDSNHGGHGDVDYIQDGDMVESDEDWSDDDMNNDHHDHESSHADPEPNSEDTHSGFSIPSVHLDTAKASQAVFSGIAASVAGAAPVPQKPIPAAASTTFTNSMKDLPNDRKVAYNITVAELETSEKIAATKGVERPLPRHWTNFTFYFMASLSIVLPFLFLLLALFIFLMNKKPDVSKWNVMPDIIKVGISAWPIVFAAVVAQVFKGYATWRVERGIKLMQLEQLVGSNSFGSAIKQPLVLRQLDTLGLLLLVTWCLSPLGSQALQRSYSTSLTEKVENITVYYLNQLRDNKAFGADWRNKTSEISHAADNQFVAMQFLSLLLPVDQNNTSDERSYKMDRYFHPILYEHGNEGFAISGAGLPILLPNTQISNGPTNTGDYTPYEYLDFNATSSYFNFTCSDWTTKNRTDLLSTVTEYQWSASRTLAMAFTNGNASSISRLSFASANLDANESVTDGTEFSHIECDFKQAFINSWITCYQTRPGKDTSSISVERQCYQNWNYTNIIPEETARSGGNGTLLESFADDWTQMGALVNSNRVGRTTTPSEYTIHPNAVVLKFTLKTILAELYLATTSNDQMDFTGYNVEAINLQDTRTPYEFANRFGYLFNTWVGIGYCQECQVLITMADLEKADQALYKENANQSVKDRYLEANATRTYSVDQVYVINIPWIVCFIVCTILLLLAGVTSVVLESMTVAPDTLGYVSTVARNSRYLHLKPTSGAMTGPERARKLADTKVMMQDVKAAAGVGKIALGLKTEKAVKLRYDRLYR